VGQSRSPAENELNRRVPPFEVKTESLVGAWATAPYEGVATPVAQVRDMKRFLLDVRGRASHGTLAGLTGRQLQDLEAFVLSIDGDTTPEEVLSAVDMKPPHLVR